MEMRLSMMNIIQNLKLSKNNIWSLKNRLPGKPKMEKPKPKWKSKRKEYTLTPADLKTFSTSGMPFLTFDEFLNIVKWYRDGFYAGMNVTNFITDIGKKYNVWTRHTVSTYHRHIIFSELVDSVTLSFEIPHLEKFASFPLKIKISDGDGIYFYHEQELAIDHLVNGKFVVTSWAKIPEIRKFLKSQCEKE